MTWGSHSNLRTSETKSVLERSEQHLKLEELRNTQNGSSSRSSKSLYAADQIQARFYHLGQKKLLTIVVTEILLPLPR